MNKKLKINVYNQTVFYCVELDLEDLNSQYKIHKNIKSIIICNFLITVQVPSVGCSSIILPYVIAAEVPSYGMPEVPGRLTINGIRPTAYAAAVA